VEIRESAGGLFRTVIVAGELDHVSAPVLQEILLDELFVHRDVVLDLQGVRFIDAAGLRALVAANNAASGLECQFIVANPQPMTIRLLRLTGLFRALRIETSEPDQNGDDTKRA